MARNASPGRMLRESYCRPLTTGLPCWKSTSAPSSNSRKVIGFDYIKGNRGNRRFPPCSSRKSDGHVAAGGDAAAGWRHLFAGDAVARHVDLDARLLCDL